MFDWNDEELTNIIWGEEGEAGDHIVPLKEKSELQLNRKEWSAGSKNGNDLGSWPEPAISKATKADQVSCRTEISNSLAEPAKYSSPNDGETSELGKGFDVFQSTDESKEQGDFVDYSWANIGSFDDLDRMFSNDVPIFGDGSLSGADELWTSSKDAPNSPSTSFPSILDSQNIGLDIKPDFEQEEHHQFSLTEKSEAPLSQNARNLCETSKGQSTIEEQEFPRKKLLKLSKMPEASEARTIHDQYGNWTPSRNSSGQFDNQMPPSLPHYSSMAMKPQRKFQGSKTFHQSPHVSNSYMAASSGFGNHTNPYSAMPVVSTIRSPDLKTQLLHHSYNVSPVTAVSVSQPVDTSVTRPLTMTPQEKVEKLRRRQQMQAMLAIQRQQQQFHHQVLGSGQSASQDNSLKLVEKSSFEEIAAQPSFDPNSPLEQNECSNFSAAVDDNSAEFSVLHRLKDVAAKLDMGIRLCIRDSLYRLAGSAVKRNHATDTPHTNKTSCDEQEAFSKKDARNSNRYAGMPDTEAVTNPIDRTVAHLLFHRPFEASTKHEEAGSPGSSKMIIEQKRDFPKRSPPESCIGKQRVPEEGPADTLASPQQMGQFESNPCIDNLESASNPGSNSASNAEIEPPR